MWRIQEYVIPKYASLAYGLFWTKGHREPADAEKVLKTGHKFPTCEGNLHL